MNVCVCVCVCVYVCVSPDGARPSDPYVTISRIVIVCKTADFKEMPYNVVFYDLCTHWRLDPEAMRREAYTNAENESWAYKM